MDQVTSGQGTATQTTTPLGSFKYTGTGWGSYQYVPLTDTYNNLVAVDLNGLATLRVTAGPGDMNFFMLVPARLDLPVIANPYPNRLLQVTNTILVQCHLGQRHYSHQRHSPDLEWGGRKLKPGSFR